MHKNEILNYNPNIVFKFIQSLSKTKFKPKELSIMASHVPSREALQNPGSGSLLMSRVALFWIRDLSLVNQVLDFISQSLTAVSMMTFCLVELAVNLEVEIQR